MQIALINNKLHSKFILKFKNNNNLNKEYTIKYFNTLFDYNFLNI